MRSFHPFSRFDNHQTGLVIAKSWFFRLASLAFIAQFTPALAVSMRGFAGFLIILSVAVFAGLVESSFNQTMRTIFKGIAKNKLLIVLVIWYIAGFILNLFLRAGGFDDWRLMLSPVVILIGLLYALGFMDDDASFRNFQIAFILVVGIQSFFSLKCSPRP